MAAPPAEIEVDLEAERERARKRREEQRLETRALRILRNPGRFTSGKNYPSRWGATRDELEEAIEKEWPGDDRAELREEVLDECLALQEERREDVTHLDPEEYAMKEKTKRLRAAAREIWEKDPDATYRDVHREIMKQGHDVSWSSFQSYHAPELRREMGLVGTSAKGGPPDRGPKQNAESEEGKGAQQDPTQRGEGADAPPEPAPPPSPGSDDEVGRENSVGESVDGPEAPPGSATSSEPLPVTPTLNGGPGRIQIQRGGQGIIAEKDDEGTWRVTVITDDGELVDRIAGACYGELFGAEESVTV